MAKQSKNISNNDLSGFIFRLCSLAGILGFLYILMSGGIIASHRFPLAIVMGILLAFAAAVTAIILVIVLSKFFPSKEKIATSFDFDAPSNKKKSKKQTPTEFEHEVAAIIQRLSGKRTQVVGGAGDGGIDVKVFKGKRLVGIVQCKRYKPDTALSPSYIRELNAVRHYHHVDVAYLVTTARFTEKSQKLAHELGIKLIDGDALERLRQKAIISRNSKFIHTKPVIHKNKKPTPQAKEAFEHPHASFMRPEQAKN